MTRDIESTRFDIVTGGERVDLAVSRQLGIGRRAARALIDDGRVLVDGRRPRCGAKLPDGAKIEIRERAEAQARLRCTESAPRVVWERAGVLCIVKPSGVHSVRGRGKASVADFLAARYPGIESVGESPADCGLVHRLDRDTSGILLAATDSETYRALRSAFSRGRVRKEYLGLVQGVLRSEIEIDLALTRGTEKVRPSKRGERGRRASTIVEPMERGEDWTLVRASMTTGVTHQIRAHLAWRGYPLIGDDKYGAIIEDPVQCVGGQRLHASVIRVNTDLALAAPPGRDFLITLAALRARAAT